jgi:hypothetical protein
MLRKSKTTNPNAFAHNEDIEIDNSPDNKPIVPSGKLKGIQKY